ncbi:MAG TPA: SRPBCC family protein [Chloroflexota bacterium]|jgi:carbon monoxide dehydrogenase subunit G|nr:SRPBCC family protein [Chloroflexota bacterium]
MPLVERSTTVAVPPERAFRFVADARNALRWMHNFTRFEPERPGVYGLGARVNATGTVLGFPIATTLEIVEFDPPKRLVSRTSGRLKSHSLWEFAPVDGGTRVTFTGEYDVPGGLLRMIGWPLVQRELETNAEISLRNLKAALEEGG